MDSHMMAKLYGLPRNTDVACIYYNQKMFEDNQWDVPETYDELLELAGKISDAGMIPMAMDGGDGWPMAVYLSDLLFQLAGTESSEIIADAIATGDFTDENLVKATEILKESTDAKLFQNGYDSQDYATAMNLFTNGQAAMFYMGSWESSMALNEDIPEEIRENIRVFTMPSVKGGKAAKTDIAAWNGGGYGVSAKSEIKEEAVKFINYMDQSEYMTGEETELMKQIVDIVNNATNVSGTPINDCGPSFFKTSIESEIQSVSNGSTSVKEFLSAIGASCK